MAICAGGMGGSSSNMFNGSRHIISISPTGSGHLYGSGIGAHSFNIPQNITDVSGIISIYATAGFNIFYKTYPTNPISIVNVAQILASNGSTSGSGGGGGGYMSSQISGNIFDYIKSNAGNGANGRVIIRFRS
jgi:hypothetical protein